MTRLLVVLLVAGLGTTTGAQRPDYTGEWNRVVDSTVTRSTVAATGDAAFRRGDMGSGWGNPLLIRQTTDSLTIEYPQFSAYDLQPPLRFVYRLDGAESVNTIMIGHSDSQQRSHASWSGDTLAIVTTFTAPTDGGTTRVRQSMFLAADGTLTLDTSREGSTVVRTAYRRRR